MNAVEPSLELPFDFPQKLQCVLPITILRHSSVFWDAIYFRALYPSKQFSRLACLPDLPIVRPIVRFWQDSPAILCVSSL